MAQLLVLCPQFIANGFHVLQLTPGQSAFQPSSDKVADLSFRATLQMSQVLDVLAMLVILEHLPSQAAVKGTAGLASRHASIA